MKSIKIVFDKKKTLEIITTLEEIVGNYLDQEDTILCLEKLDEAKHLVDYLLDIPDGIFTGDYKFYISPDYNIEELAADFEAEHHFPWVDIMNELEDDIYYRERKTLQELDNIITWKDAYVSDDDMKFFVDYIHARAEGLKLFLDVGYHEIVWELDEDYDPDEDSDLDGPDSVPVVYLDDDWKLQFGNAIRLPKNHQWHASLCSNLFYLADSNDATLVGYRI